MSSSEYPDCNGLYGRHGRWLERRLTGLFGIADAEELAQEAWVRLIPYTAVHPVRHPRAMLLRIATNLAIDRAKRRARCEAYTVQAAHLQREEAHQETSVLLEQVVLRLPEPLRDVFLLSRVAGLNNAQIGERLGISSKTVEWRLTKALAHCAAQLRR